MKGLTEGGRGLLKELLDPKSKSAKSWIGVMEDIMSRPEYSANRWSVDHEKGVHVLDAKDGITLDDYKLIKATLMVQGKWTA